MAEISLDFKGESRGAVDAAKSLDHALSDLGKTAEPVREELKKVLDGVDASHAEGQIRKVKEDLRSLPNSETVVIDLDAERAKRGVGEFKRDLESVTGKKVKIDADMTPAERAIAHFKAEVEAFKEGKIKFTGDDADFKRTVAAMEAQVQKFERLAATKKFKGDDSDLLRTIVESEAALNKVTDKTVELKAVAHTTEARLEISRLEEKMEQLRKQALETSLAMKLFGSGSGSGPVSGVLGFFGALPPLISASLVMLTQLGGIFNALIAGAVALVAALAPLVGIFAALPGAIAGGIAVLGTLKLAFDGVGDAIKKQTAAQEFSASAAGKAAQAHAAAAEKMRKATKDVEDAANSQKKAEEALQAAERDAAALAQKYQAAKQAEAAATRRLAEAERELAKARQEEKAAAEAITRDEQKLAAARDEVKASAQAVADAEQNVSDAEDALAQSHQDVIDAEQNLKDAHQAVADAVDNLKAAEQNLADAQGRVLDAQKNLNDAREQAKRDLEDYTNSVIDSKFAEEDATFAVQDARDELAKTEKAYREGKATAEDVAKAKLRLAEAEQRLKEAHERTTRATEDNNKAQKEGVEGAPGVVSAKKTLADAEQGVVDATKQVAKAQEGVQKALQNVSKAERELAQRHKDEEKAQRNVLKAQRELAAAQERSAKAQAAVVKLLKQLVGDHARYKKAQEDVATASDKVRKRHEEVAAAAEKTRKAHNAYEKELGVVKSRQDDVTKATEKLDKAHREQQKAAEALAKSTSTIPGPLAAAKKAMDALTPSQKKFVDFVVSQRDKLKELKQVAGEGVFSGLTKGLKAAATDKNWDALKSLVGNTGKAIGGVFEGIGKELAKPAWSRDIEAIGKRNAGVIGTLGHALRNLLQPFRDLAVVALKPPDGFIPWIAKGIEKMTQWIATTIHTARENGKLAHFFDVVKKTMKELWDILKPLAISLFNIGKAAKPLGDSILKQLADQAERLQKWTESEGGKQTLRKYFQQAGPVLKTAGHLLGDIVKVLLSLGGGQGKLLLGLLDKLVHVLGNSAVQKGLILLGGISLSARALQPFAKLGEILATIQKGGGIAKMLGVGEEGLMGALGLGAPEIAIIAGAVALLVLFFTKTKEGQHAFKEISATFKEVWQKDGPGLVKSFKELWQALQPVVKIIADVLVIAVKLLAWYIEHVVIPEIKLYIAWTKLWVDAIDLIIGWVKQLIGWVKDLPGHISAAKDAIVGFVKDGVQALTGFVSNIIGAITGAIGNASAEAGKLGRGILNGVVNGITGIANRVAGFFQRVVGAIRNAVAGAFNAAQRLGGRILAGVVAGITGIVTRVARFYEGIIRSIIGFYVRFYTAAFKLGGRILSGVVAGITGIGARIVNFFSGIWRSLVSFITTAYNLAVKIGKAIFDGIVHGITHVAKSIGKTVWDGIKHGLGEVMTLGGILSPSKYTRDRIGVPLGQGIEVGMKQALDKADFGPHLKRMLTRISTTPAHNAGINIGKAIVGGIASGIYAAQGDITKAVRGAVGNAMKHVKIDFKISSPSKVTQDEIGVPLGQGIVAGALLGLAQLSSALSDAIGRAVAGAAPAAPSAPPAGFGPPVTALATSGVHGLLTDNPTIAAATAAFAGRTPGRLGAHAHPPVIVNVHGNVWTQKDLTAAIRDELIRVGRRNGGAPALFGG